MTNITLDGVLVRYGNKVWDMNGHRICITVPVRPELDKWKMAGWRMRKRTTNTGPGRHGLRVSGADRSAGAFLGGRWSDKTNRIKMSDQ